MGCKDTRCRFINSIKTDCHYSWSRNTTPRIMVDKKRLYREEDNSGIIGDILYGVYSWGAALWL